MSNEILWLHDKALRHDYAQTHPNSNIIHIWDDDYYQQRQYSLKRLVFIYETLCAIANIEIIHGNIADICSNANRVCIPYTADSVIRQYCKRIAKLTPIEIIKTDDFVQIGDGYEFTRFFKYWNKAKKTAFLIDGGIK